VQEAHAKNQEVDSRDSKKRCVILREERVVQMITVITDEDRVLRGG